MREKSPPYSLKAFTLSEVLITLVIIGVVAAITVPALLNSLENTEYKVAYKKAYSDLSNAVAESLAFGEFPYRSDVYNLDTTKEEWELIKRKFGIMKVCESDNAFDCWVDADKICTGECGQGSPTSSSFAFIDLSGRSWAIFYIYSNIYLADTNGDKGPNRFGKDRWLFTFADENNKRICSKIGNDVCVNPGVAKKVIPYIKEDISTKSGWCNYPPCNYKSWLLN